jgi:hypothetical protein
MKLTGKPHDGWQYDMGLFRRKFEKTYENVTQDLQEEISKMYGEYILRVFKIN